MQMLKQGKRSVDEYYKEMELLLVWDGIREDPESKMERFLGGLNEEIPGFVEMFPYHTLQDLVDQAMHTKRKIQQETREKSYASHCIAAPWRMLTLLNAITINRLLNPSLATMSKLLYIT